MLYLALMTLIFFTSPLEREVDRTVEEYLSQLDLHSNPICRCHRSSGATGGCCASLG